MNDVIVEREYETAVSKEELLLMSREGASCMRLYNIAWKTSFLAENGRTLACHFQAADAETVRTALRQIGVETKAIWSGALHDTGIEKSPNVVVERRFDEAASLESIQALEDASAHCLELHNVTFIKTLFSLDKKRMLCLYHAPDAESVRVAQRKASMPVEQIWACQVIDPPTESPL